MSIIFHPKWSWQLNTDLHFPEENSLLLNNKWQNRLFNLRLFSLSPYFVDKPWISIGALEGLLRRLIADKRFNFARLTKSIRAVIGVRRDLSRWITSPSSYRIISRLSHRCLPSTWDINKNRIQKNWKWKPCIFWYRVFFCPNVCTPKCKKGMKFPWEITHK